MDRDSSSKDQEDPSQDPMAPPAEPCECTCLHCGRVFMSDRMWFQRVIGSRDGFKGFWMCPTPNCSGAGFCFDIFPTDPDHPANEGWVEIDDEDFEAEWDEDPDEQREWDPTESKYKKMDQEALEQEDLEGEEWKYAGEGPLKSGDGAMDISGISQAMSEEEKMYNQPDQRPREVDWSNREEPVLGEDDIPF